MQFRQVISNKQLMKLSQVMAPHLIQMMKRFQMGYADFSDYVLEESKDNVFVKVVREGSLHHQLGPLNRSLKSSNDVPLSAIDMASDTPSLNGLLMDQLDMESLNDLDTKVGQYLIDAIDDRGYITEYPKIRDEIVKDLSVKERKVHDVLKIIQTFEPEGVGARSLKECMLIQIAQNSIDDMELEDVLHLIVMNHLDDLGDGKYQKIADKCDIDLEDVSAVHSFIRQNINPNPGSKYAASQFNFHVAPSFSVKFESESVILKNLERDSGVSIEINKDYDQLINQKGIDVETKTFLESQYDKAKQLVHDLNERHRNLERLVEYIASKQKSFIQYGEAFLEPLLQKDVAKTIGISSSTVSRIVTSKYIETPHGIIPLKKLCPRSFYGKTSKRLQLIVHDFAERYPQYSDQKITEACHEIGIPIARRTVTKYRALLGVKSSYERDLKNDKSDTSSE